MNKNLQWAQQLIRRAHLLPLVERLRYRVSLAKYARRGRAFRREFPAFALPPAHLAYDAFAAPNWHYYKRSGEQTAHELAAAFARHARAAGSLAVLEWGCGPGRVIRHLPGALPAGALVAGTDYNPESVDWCRAHIPAVDFRLNGLQPPLPFEEASFDVVYALSVFTHLAERTALAWVEDLRRVLRPDGLLLFTSNGDYYKTYMLPDELAAYEAKDFVERSGFEEGKKMFIAFHAPRYVRERLLRHFEVIEHRPSGATSTSQDLWLARKRRGVSPHEDTRL